MKKVALTPADKALVKAAIAVAKKPVKQLRGEKAPPKVAAAVRLDNGKIVTGTNLIAKPSNMSTCAEAIAIAASIRQPERTMKTIVAICHEPDHAPKIAAPCGKCRELITQYAKGAYVILRMPGTNKVFKVKAEELLPIKFADFWQEKELI